MYKKIVYDFVGTSGCGKTTIMNDVLPIFERFGRSVNIVESSSRTMLEKFNLKLYDKTSDFTQCFISLINWTDILESIQKYDVTLCTDLGIRSLAYTMYSALNSNVTTQAHRKMVQFFTSDLFTSDILPVWVYLPLEINMDINHKDKHRGYVKVKEHKKICDLVKYALVTLDVPYYVLTGDKEGRLLKMEGLIEQMDTALDQFTHVGGHVL